MSVDLTNTSDRPSRYKQNLALLCRTFAGLAAAWLVLRATIVHGLWAIRIVDLTIGTALIVLLSLGAVAWAMLTIGIFLWAVPERKIQNERWCSNWNYVGAGLLVSAWALFYYMSRSTSVNDSILYAFVSYLGRLIWVGA